MKHNQIIITSSDHEDPKFLNILESLHNIHPYIKFNTFDVVKYTKPTDDQIEENEFTFRLMTRQFNGPNDLDMLNSELETRMQEQEMNQSGWSMQRFIKRTMYIHRFYPTGGCTTELPFTCRYILNIKNTDNKCLLWCLIAYLHPAKDNQYRVSNYNKPEYINEIKLPNGITPPYDYYHLKKIQELNKDKVLFNVFNLNKNKTINPVLINHNDSKGCNILYWDNHYFLCKDVSFLLRKSTKHKCYPCLKCCVSFRTEDALNKHLERCNNTGRRTFHKDEYLKFDKFHYKNRVPFAMYYDFECIIKDGKHLPIACGLYLRSDYPEILEHKYECYCGEKVVDWFVERVDYYNKLFKDIFSMNIPMKEDTITPLYSRCYYCNEEMGEDVVRDHDHLNGKFRGYAHNKCNLQAKNNFVPMYAFNSSNYDNHLFITKLAKKTRVKVLTKTDENYISIDMGYAKALDMYRFFHPLSLDAISKTLSNEECITLNKCGLERRKGIFPYEWFDSIDKLHETALPPKEAFYSKLKQCDITDKEYKQAIDCWNETKCETIKDYMMLYLKTDVLLSVDVFEKFRAMCLEFYEIDPCYTYSTPGLTWLCGLKYTIVWLKYYKENTVNIYDTIQHGIRGGLASVLGNCHVKCKNKEIDPEYTGTENYLKYLDFNSLYASAMVQPLPTGEIRVCEDLAYTKSSSNTGYIYTIDIKYNDELRQKTKKYPFFPEKTKANIDQFTNYQNENKKKGYKPNEKLMLKLTDKENYVIDGEMLDWYLDHGLKLEDVTIKQKLEYNKSEWLKPYIELNIQKRKEAKAKGDKFGDVFFKLMNNAFYGKTIENVYNRQDVELVNDVDRYIKLVENISFKYAVEFDDDLVAVHKTRGNVKLDKFNYIGFVILEKAKLFMYKAIYDYFEKELDCSYHYTDTDSIFININVPLDSTIEKEMNKIKGILHNNELGKMKDEIPNDTIMEACFLKAKAYCYNTVKREEEKKLKGITKATIRNQINLEDYTNAIYEGKSKYVTNYTIDSKRHNLETKEQYKIAIDPFDDKGIKDSNGEFRFYE